MSVSTIVRHLTWFYLKEKVKNCVCLSRMLDTDRWFIFVCAKVLVRGLS